MKNDRKGSCFNAFLIIICLLLAIPIGMYMLGMWTSTSRERQRRESEKQIEVAKQEVADKMRKEAAATREQQQKSLSEELDARATKQSPSNHSDQSVVDKKPAVDKTDEWTPDAIRKEPVRYLQAKITECGVFSEKLDTKALSLETLRKRASREALGKKMERDAIQGFLATLKAQYNAAAESKTWPTVQNGVTLSEIQLKQKIVGAHNKVESYSRMAETHQKSEKLYGDELAEISRQQTRIIEAKRKLSADLEIVKANKETHGTEGITSAIDTMTDISQTLAKPLESPDLDALATKEVTSKQDNDEFDRIMNKKE
ncbi:MAG: hypothetical protein WCP12_08045 [bacterium]